MRTTNRPEGNLAGFVIASRLRCTVPASFLLLDSCNIFTQLEADSEVFVFFQAMISVQLHLLPQIYNPAFGCLYGGKSAN